MRDIGNEETEKLIAEMEKKIRREYAQAEKELNEKFNEYVRKFKVKDAIKKQQLARGEITQEFYEYWRKGQFSVAFRWQEMRRTMADDLTTVSQKARSIVDGYRPEAYAINHDYITFLIEKDSGIDTSYTLYNTRSAERLLRDERVLPKPGKSMKGKIERGEVVKWQEGRIQSVTLQSLLQGESTEHMAQRICRTLSVSNYADAVRYARTAMTGAQNGGRFDAISRCRDEGIDVVGQWSATLDGRTRHTHRQIDGEVAEPGEMFSNGCRFPGDPKGPASEIWRCRCRLNERVRGYTKDPSDLTRRNTDHMEEDTYEEWKNAKAPKDKKEAGTVTSTKAKETSIGNLNKPQRPRKHDYNDSQKFDEARQAYRVKKEKYNQALDNVVQKSCEQTAFKSEKELLDWASRNNITVDKKVLEQIDLRSFNEVEPTLDEMFKRFPEVKNFEAQGFSGERIRFNFGIGLTDDGLLSANGGFNFNPRMFSNYEDGLRDALDSIADGTFVRGDGSFATTVRHEYGHNVQNYIEFGLSDKYKQGADDWRKNFSKFEDWQEANKAYREEYTKYNNELLSLAGKKGSSEYSNTNRLELFAEGFAEWSSGGKSEFATEFGKFFKRWY